MNTATKSAAPKRVMKKADATATATPAAAPAKAVPAESKAVVAEVAAPATEKKARATKAAAAPAATPAPAAPVVAAPATTEATAEETTWQTELRSVQQQLVAVRDAANTALSALKSLERRVSRDLKEARKGKRKARAEPADGAPRPPSEFQKPKQISDELCAFLGLAKGTQLSRAEVTKSVNAYVKKNELNNGQNIKHNAALRALLGISETDELTIFNMQKFLNRHYIKPAATA